MYPRRHQARLRYRPSGRILLLGCLLSLAMTLLCMGARQICVYADPGPFYACGHLHDAACGYVQAVPEQPCTHVHDAACGYSEGSAGSPCAMAAAHVHDAACGYSEGTAGSSCAYVHVHDASCGYMESVAGSLCTFAHEHDASCGYAEEMEGQLCAVEAAHVHDDTCGYDPATGLGCTFTHQHDDSCGYAAAVAGSPCTFAHVHDESCGYVEAVAGSPCTDIHVHDAACGYVEAAPASPCAFVHEHDAACGYAEPVPAALCSHVHDDLCGYAAAIPGQPCTHVCDICLYDIQQRSFSADCGDSLVTVAGPLPAGGQLRAAAIPSLLARALVVEAYGEGQSVCFAYELSLLLEGEAWQPVEHENQVSVTFSQLALDPAAELTLLHISEGRAEIVTPEAVSAQAVTFSADHFSVYIGITPLLLPAAQLYYDGAAFYLDEACGQGPVTDREGRPLAALPELLALIEEDTTITLLDTYTVTDSQSLDSDYSVTLLRQRAYDGPLLTVAEDGDLTLSRITVDGGSFSAHSPALLVEAGGALTLASGALVQNNLNSGFGGALFIAGDVYLTGGTLRHNSAASGGGAYLGGRGTLTVSGGSLGGGVDGQPENPAGEPLSPLTVLFDDGAELTALGIADSRGFAYDYEGAGLLSDENDALTLWLPSGSYINRISASGASGALAYYAVEEGESIQALACADGFSACQWQRRGQDGTWLAIEGATDGLYTLSGADGDSQLRAWLDDSYATPSLLVDYPASRSLFSAPLAAISQTALYTTPGIYYDQLTSGGATVAADGTGAFTACFGLDYSYYASNPLTLIFSSDLPSGTSLILIDHSAAQPSFYYYICAGSTVSLPLTSFTKMGTSATFVEDTSASTVAKAYQFICQLPAGASVASGTCTLSQGAANAGSFTYSGSRPSAASGTITLSAASGGAETVTATVAPSASGLVAVSLLNGSNSPLAYPPGAAVTLGDSSASIIRGNLAVFTNVSAGSHILAITGLPAASYQLRVDLCLAPAAADYPLASSVDTRTSATLAVSAARGDSLSVSGSPRVLVPGGSLTVTVTYQLSAAQTLTVTRAAKSGDSYGAAADETTASLAAGSGSTTLTLTAPAAAGTYRYYFSVPGVTTVPFNIIVR